VRSETSRGRSHAVWLLILLVAFLFRVGAQLWQALWPMDWLPPFEAWQSGTISYRALLISQILIIVLLLWLIASLFRGTMKSNVRLGRIITWIGIIYFTGAVVRFVAGLTFARDVPFLSAHLPGFFHIVLATAVLIAGDFFRARATLIPPRGDKRGA